MNKQKEVMQQLDQFYKKNQSEKDKTPNISGKGPTRGYFRIGTESGDKDLVELKESFSFGYENIPEQFMKQSYLVADNIWPQEFEKQKFLIIHEAFYQTSLQILQLINETFNLNQEADHTCKYESFVRSFRYYPTLQNIKAQQTGNSLHTDWNLITLVWADEPGLQYQEKDGQFVDVHSQEHNNGALICNFGDYLSSLTDGIIKSPWHRVYIPKKIRNSLVYFLYPRFDAPIVDKVIYNNGKPLGLFVDQSQSGGILWNIDKNKIKNMGQLYSKKWKQVSREY